MLSRRSLSLFLASGLTGASEASGGTRLSRSVRLSLTFFNPTERALRNQRYDGYLPMRRASAQRAVSVQVSMPHVVDTDSTGHQALVLHFDELAPYARRTVSVSVVMDMFSSPFEEPVPPIDRWLREEPLVEVGDPRIRQRAAELAGNNEWATGRAIFDWVSRNIEYAGYLEHPMGAAAALQGRRGDCTEYADLVVALARANGIAARRVGGHHVAQDGLLTPAQYHDWAELYLEGSWRVVDAQKRNWLRPAEQYLAFHVEGRDVSERLRGHSRFRIGGGMLLE